MCAVLMLSSRDRLSLIKSSPYMEKTQLPALGRTLPSDEVQPVDDGRTIAAWPPASAVAVVAAERTSGAKVVVAANARESIVRRSDGSAAGITNDWHAVRLLLQRVPHRAPHR